MNETEIISYDFNIYQDINESYMPFIKDGALFLPIKGNYFLGQEIQLVVTLPGSTTADKILAMVIWITPENAIDHVQAGFGAQFIGDNASSFNQKILSIIDNTADIGGYVYGINIGSAVE